MGLFIFVPYLTAESRGAVHEDSKVNSIRWDPVSLAWKNVCHSCSEEQNEKWERKSDKEGMLFSNIFADRRLSHTIEPMK